MCYSIYLSTNYNGDLSVWNSELITFKKMHPSEVAGHFLKFKNIWYVGSKSQCSCTFRHISASELGFSPPEDWYEEQGDEIAGTRIFIHKVRNILMNNHPVDCIDIWHDSMQSEIAEKTVNLSSLNEDQFRFFENYYFLFSCE